MPVARIYTRHPDESAGLAARLRAHGYTIDIADPGTFHVTPADLEIQLDRLRTGEAITKAVRFARERDAQVFVGAGFALEDEAQRALQGAVERGNVFSSVFHSVRGLLRRTRRAGAEAHAVRAARRQQKLDMELAREAERKRRADAAAAERAEREQREREQEERRQGERAAILARQREEEEQRRQEEVRLAAAREAQLAEQRRQEELQRQEHAAAATRLAAEEAERRRVEDEAARIEHERQAQLLARVAHQRYLAEHERIAEQPALPAAPPVANRPVVKPRMVPPPPVARESERITKRAFIAAAVIAILVAAGWGAYENRMPAAPLSNSQMVRGSQIQQDVPFGAATIKPAAQPQANTVRPPAVQAQTRSQAHPKSAQNQPAPQPAKPAATRPRHKQRFTDDTDVIADDQVIYHGTPKKSASATANARPQQQVKKISDLGDQ